MFCLRTTPGVLLRNRLKFNYRNKIYKEARSLSILNYFVPSTDLNHQLARDLDHAIAIVRKYDPSGYFPGLMTATREVRTGYFAVRAFWLQSKLRFEEAPTLNNLSASRQVQGSGQRGIEVSDIDRLQKLRIDLDSLYKGKSDYSSIEENPSLRLLHYVIQKHNLSRNYFDDILTSRELDINRKQYPTLSSMIDHANMSCGSLFRLILECSNIRLNDGNNVIYRAAKDIGIAHGLVNALRTSVPVASTTGKIIIPQDLCEKYGVRSPRYLLSALGMGDEECRKHLRSAVEDISNIARNHLEQARFRRKDILANPDGHVAMSVFLPGLTSEIFLKRLEIHKYDLTDRNLRNVGLIEHSMCVGQILSASYRKEY